LFPLALAVIVVYCITLDLHLTHHSLPTGIFLMICVHHICHETGSDGSVMFLI